jgi:dodecin
LVSAIHIAASRDNPSRPAEFRASAITADGTRLRPKSSVVHEAICDERSGRSAMSDHVYSVSELVGSSTTGIEDAIANAIGTAGKTLRNLEWFEVSTIRGHIVDGSVHHYQVALKIGFRYESR